MTPVLIAFARLSVDVAPPVTVLSTDAGERRFVAIRGGTMEGDIAAEILPGGADWQWVGADGVVEIDAHYTLRTADGEILELRSQGVRRPPLDGTPGSFWSSITLRGDGPSRKLTQHLFLASGERTPEGVHLTLYRCS
jgi:hypothetical protein